MMNTGGDVIESISSEIEAENDAHFSFSVEDNAGDAEHEYREVDRINTDSRMPESLSEQLLEQRSHICITSLPQELIAMIFSHLDAYFLFTTVTHVCWYFHNVLKSEGFWKSRKMLYINEKESGIDFIMTVIPKCPNICHLSVNFRYEGPETKLTIPNMSFPHLHSLVMTNVDPRAENAVEMIVQGAPHLRVIILKGSTTEEMLEVIALAKELTTFSVYCISDHFMKYEPILSYIFKNCCKLETVYIDLFPYVDMDPLLTLLEVCSGTLKRLSWSSEVSDLVMEKLSTCPQISHLDIKMLSITNGSSKFIRNMKQIETLRLKSCNLWDDTYSLTSEGYIEMFKGNAFPLLKHLSFDSCDEVDDTVLEVIATNLKDLESLELCDTNVTDLGICFMLGHCSNLRALRLWQSNVEYSFVKDLPICCPRLHFLVLFGKPVPAPIIQEFLNTHPSYDLKKCGELTDLYFRDLIRISLSDLSLNAIIAFIGDDKVDHIMGH